MTLLGFVELSHTPKRAVRGLVLSTGLAWGFCCAQLGADTSAMAMATVAIVKLRKRIDVDSLKLWGKNSPASGYSTTRCTAKEWLKRLTFSSCVFVPFYSFFSSGPPPPPPTSGRCS